MHNVHCIACRNCVSSGVGKAACNVPTAKELVLCLRARASQSEDASYDLLNGILREVRESQCCAEGLSKAGKERIREVVGRDIAGHLLIQI